MKQHINKLMALGSIAILLTTTSLMRAADMQERIQSAIEILGQKQSSSEPIPKHIRDHAKGIAIFTLTKGGLGIGGQGGEGIVVARLGTGSSHTWTAPSAFNLSGASLGAQIGFTEARYIVILNTEDAIRHFTSSGKVDWNAAASGTAGSDSATDKVSTNDLENREIIVYKDTSGIFGGATFGGTSVERKDKINQMAYGDDVFMKNILNGTVTPPKSATQLYILLDAKV